MRRTLGETKRQQGHHRQEHGSALQDPTLYQSSTQSATQLATQSDTLPTRGGARGGTTTGKCGEHCGETKRQQGHHRQEHGSALQDPTSYQSSTQSATQLATQSDTLQEEEQEEELQQANAENTAEKPSGNKATIVKTALQGPTSYALHGSTSNHHSERCIFGRIETARCLQLFHYSKNFTAAGDIVGFTPLIGTLSPFLSGISIK
ncbi:hypothetical protein HO173_001484 [Letharia columbiana]|uniref:Uncharacterized protein n=1 Tax=Letharia columbiana TaxID=112416 RepID=A0A8H6G5C0_9LECA|nr:uncharacterized protein HO173_001484 [Letharia columbiana]KAF6240811.1 hypothetical protein HO173_001484 [Letharia columbiana]